MSLHVRGLRLAFWPFLLRFKAAEVAGLDAKTPLWERRRAFMQEWDGRQYTIRRVTMPRRA